MPNLKTYQGKTATTWKKGADKLKIENKLKQTKSVDLTRIAHGPEIRRCRIWHLPPN